MKGIVSTVMTVLLLIAALGGVGFVTANAETSGKLVEGDVILETPAKTTDKVAEITDGSKLAEGTFTLGWDAFEGAHSYSIRIFFNIASEDTKEGVDFRYIGEVTSDITSVTVGSLAPNWRYTVVIYALDAEGNEIATYDRIPVATIPLLEEKNEEETRKEGLSLLTTVIIAVVAILVIAAVIITIVLLSTKPKSLKKQGK